ncbi:hypothetical protein HK100_002097 [Physocladia obscura]|uniref:Uncharacterized protein n=1 Tax=Physocladia obscura TaxID=109957 RepID=A0AAD5SXW4_9FUNG|nr:hypothetical protein HK100_002097 [Physocladia obscura]
MNQVLCATIKALVEFHNANYDTKLAVKDFVTYNYEDIWGGTREEAIAKVREFYGSSHFSEHMTVVPGAKEALISLKVHFDLVIVTARQELVHAETHRFVAEHFPNIFTEVHFANHFLTPEEATRLVSKTKSELCREVGASILIDDSLVHALDCAKSGLRVFLFDHEGAYGWNKLASDDNELPTNIERVHQWSDIVNALMTF